MKRWQDWGEGKWSVHIKKKDVFISEGIHIWPTRNVPPPRISWRWEGEVGINVWVLGAFLKANKHKNKEAKALKCLPSHALTWACAMTCGSPQNRGCSLISWELIKYIHVIHIYIFTYNCTEGGVERAPKSTEFKSIYIWMIKKICFLIN